MSSLPLPQLPSEIDIDSFQLPARLDEITQSSLVMATNCQQQFALRYLYRLKRRGTATPLLIGSAAHAGFEALLQPGDNSDIDNRLNNARHAIDQVFDAVLEKSDELATINTEGLQTAQAQAQAVVEAWYIVNGHEAATWHVAANEISIRCASSHDASKLHWLDRAAGKIDGVVVVGDRTYIHEYKTKSTLNGFDVASLSLDNQLLWYATLSHYHWDRLSATRKLPKPSGALYDIVVKPRHKLNSKGPDDLRQRMVQAMVEAPEKYFLLETIDIDEEMLQRAFKRFGRLVQQLDSIGRDSNITMNTARCNDYGGCAYRMLCQAGADANEPRSVFTAPGIDAYEFADAHGELTEETPSEPD